MRRKQRWIRFKGKIPLRLLLTGESFGQLLHETRIVVSKLGHQRSVELLEALFPPDLRRTGCDRVPVSLQDASAYLRRYVALHLQQLEKPVLEVLLDGHPVLLPRLVALLLKFQVLPQKFLPLAQERDIDEKQGRQRPQGLDAALQIAPQLAQGVKVVIARLQPIAQHAEDAGRGPQRNRAPSNAGANRNLLMDQSQLLSRGFLRRMSVHPHTVLHVPGHFNYKPR